MTRASDNLQEGLQRGQRVARKEVADIPMTASVSGFLSGRSLRRR